MGAQMKFTHEYINSFGVIVAILVAFSSVMERAPAIPIVKVQTYPPTKPTIVERVGSQLRLTTNHHGVFRILNTNRQKAHVSLSYGTDDECKSDTQTRKTGIVNILRKFLQPVFVIPTDEKSNSRPIEIIPGQLSDIPWDVIVRRPPDRSGTICVAISTLLADGGQFRVPYRVGFFSNEFNEKKFEFSPFSAREILSKAEIVENGTPTDLTEDEREILLTAGDIQFDSMSPLKDIKDKAVPERTCLNILAWRWCKIGEY